MDVTNLKEDVGKASNADLAADKSSGNKREVETSLKTYSNNCSSFVLSCALLQDLEGDNQDGGVVDDDDDE